MKKSEIKSIIKCCLIFSFSALAMNNVYSQQEKNESYSASIIEYTVNSVAPNGNYTVVTYGQLVEVAAWIENTSALSSGIKTFYLSLSFSRTGEPEYYLPPQPLHLSPEGQGGITYSFPIPDHLEPEHYNLNVSIWDDYIEGETDITQALIPNPNSGLPYDEALLLPAFDVNAGNLTNDPFGLASYDNLGIFNNIPKRHRNNRMPDLEAYYYNQRSLMAVDRTNGGFSTRPLNQNDENIIIVIHGWMLFWESYNGYIYNLGDKWPTLLGNLNSSEIIDDSWSIVEYDWFNDAYVKDVSILLPFTKQEQTVNYNIYQKNNNHDEAKFRILTTLFISGRILQYTPIIAAYRSYQHGLMIAKKLQQQVGLQNLSNVQIICHSAGTWAALALTQYLGNQINNNNLELNLQTIYLDPFIPDKLSLHSVSYMSSNQLRSSSLFTTNSSSYQGSQGYFNTGTQDDNIIDEIIGPATMIDFNWPANEGFVLNTDYYSNNAPSGSIPHDVPIYYYAHSVLNPTSSLFQGGGWKKSLAYKYINEGSDPDPVYNNDFEVENIVVNPPNPIHGENVSVSATLKNVGTNTQSAGKPIKFFVNGVLTETKTTSFPFDPGESWNYYFDWTANQGTNNFKIQSELPGDENPSNDFQETSIYVGVQGNLLINGESNPTVNITQNPNTSVSYSVQLFNDGSAPVSGTIEKLGNQASWITLTGGTSFYLSQQSNLSYNYKVNIPSNVSPGNYNAKIKFNYQDQQSGILNINISVVEFEEGHYEALLHTGIANIDGSWQSTNYIRHQINSAGYVLLDNYPDPEWEDFFELTKTLTPDEFSRLNRAEWNIYQIEPWESTYNARVRVTIPGTSFLQTYNSQVFNLNFNILETVINGSNTFRFSLDNFTHNQSNNRWYVNGSVVTLSFSKSAWSTNHSVSQSIVNDIAAGYDYSRIYFNVDNVQNPGVIRLYRNGKSVGTKTISSTGSNYINVVGGPEVNNHFVIRGDADNNTKLTISDLTFITKYYLGEPNILATKELNLQNVTIGEDVLVNRSFENTGSNIARSVSYNDNLPNGLGLVSGSLNGSINRIKPGENFSGNFTIKGNEVGTYVFGASNVNYTNESGDAFQTSFNAVTLVVNGGSLILEAELDEVPENPGETLFISATAKGSILNNPIYDAILTCKILKPNNEEVSFFLIYNEEEGTYKGEFSQTYLPGIYIVNISGSRDYYEEGSLVEPLSFTINSPLSVICLEYFSVCINSQPFNLSLNDLCHVNGSYPSGGTFSGEGVFFDGVSYYFDPVVGLGQYNISYCFTDPGTGLSGCDNFIMEVLPLPEVICPSNIEVSLDDQAFQLSGGFPSGGEYVLNGVNLGTNPTFDPAIAGVGTHLISYHYPYYEYITIPVIPPDPEPCINTCEFFITVTGDMPPGSSCDNPYFANLPIINYQNTTGPYGNHYQSTWVDPSSYYLDGNDFVIQFDIDESGYLSGSVSGASNSWLGLIIVQDCPNPEFPAQRLALGTGSAGGSFVDVLIEAGTYFAIVSTWPPPEYAEFTLNMSFQPLQECPAPTNLTATNITNNSANLNWTEVGIASLWNIEWGLAGFEQGTGTFVEGVGNPFNLTGLDHSTNYAFYVQSVCAGMVSSWAGPYQFSTLDENNNCWILGPDNFIYQVTTGRYSETSDLNLAVQEEYGLQAEVADWNDLLNHFSSNITQFLDSICIFYGNREGVMLKRDGQFFFDSERQYFFNRFDGVVSPGYWVHDQIDNNTLVLGSWYNLNNRILAKYPASSVSFHTITSTAGGGGTINPTGDLTVINGDDITFFITPNDCYQVSDVLVDGQSVGPVSSYTFQNVQENHTIHAVFEELTFTITASAGTGGSITPAGSITVNCGASQTFTITPNQGYFVDNVVVDGFSVGAVTSYTFENVTENHSIHATFSQIPTYTLTLGVNPTGAGVVTGGGNYPAETEVSLTATENECYDFVNWTKGSEVISPLPDFSYTMPAENVTLTANFQLKTHTITASAGTGGSISSAGNVIVECGEDQTFIINPDDCYQVKDVLVDGVSVGDVSSYTFANVTGPHSIEVLFEKITYTITASAGTGGSITPTGTLTVECGEDQTFTITPDDCYRILDVLVDGVSVGDVSPYTFANVSGPHSIEVLFEKKTYTITASAGTGGSITPEGTVTVECGEDQTFNITPGECYQILDVLVDGLSVGPVSSYTFSDVDDNHTIEVLFQKLTYTISASVAAGGSITPEGNVTVECGEDQTLTITPDDCYRILDVLVDGVSVGDVSSYPFANVTGPHSIEVLFEKITYTITASAGMGGSIAPEGTVTVECGEDQTFTITPENCHQIMDVLVDGESVESVSSYTFQNVQNNHTIHVVFEEFTIPSVITLPVSAITQNSAISGGMVTDNGPGVIMSRGVVWSTNPMPTLADHLGMTMDGPGFGTFISIITGLNPGTNYYMRAYAINCAGVGYGIPIPFTTLEPQLPLCEALDNCELDFSTGGDAVWFGQTEVSHDGVDAAQSGSITHNQESWFQTSIQGPGTISFWWKVSSEEYFDFLRFFINDNQKHMISGETDWQFREYTLDEGENILRWAYTKDGSESHGQDKAWVDQVQFNPISAPGVVTKPVTDITSSSSISGGDVIKDGGAPVISRGVVWSSISENPTLEDNEGMTEDGIGMGEFTSIMENLEYFTPYYVRAYARNWFDVAYGQTEPFTTLDPTNIELESLSGLKIYPNPARSEVWIELINTSGKEIEILFTNLQGQLYETRKIEDQGKILTSFNVVDLPPGVYLLILRNDKLNFVRKVVIQK
ncbi:MAG: fibronectin type III domain-containing protein [Bacteroidales bacterium]